MGADQFNAQPDYAGDQYLRLADIVPGAGLAFGPAINAQCATLAVLIVVIMVGSQLAAKRCQIFGSCSSACKLSDALAWNQIH